MLEATVGRAGTRIRVVTTRTGRLAGVSTARRRGLRQMTVPSAVQRRGPFWRDQPARESLPPLACFGDDVGVVTLSYAFAFGGPPGEDSGDAHVLMCHLFGAEEDIEFVCPVGLHRRDGSDPLAVAFKTRGLHAQNGAFRRLLLGILRGQVGLGGPDPPFRLSEEIRLPGRGRRRQDQRKPGQGFLNSPVQRHHFVRGRPGLFFRQRRKYFRTSRGRRIAIAGIHWPSL
jgi:hypothetical protein